MSSWLRRQIGVSVVNGVTAPKALVEALARFDTQSRNIDYLVLPPAAAGEIAAGVVDERSIRDLKPADVASYRQFHAFSGIGEQQLHQASSVFPSASPTAHLA